MKILHVHVCLDRRVKPNSDCFIRIDSCNAINDAVAVDVDVAVAVDFFIPPIEHLFGLRFETDPTKNASAPQNFKISNVCMLP